MKYKTSNRRKEVTITRLRIGMCKLNYYLNKIDKNIDSKCSSCNVNEDIEHFLTECCNNNAMLESLKRECARMNVDFCLSNILECKALIDIIYNYIVSIDRQL